MQSSASTRQKIHTFVSEYLAPGISVEDALSEISNTYHHFEAAIYDAAHPDIWQNKSHLADAIQTFVFSKTSQPVSILDLGCGTGFVSEVVLGINQPQKIEKLVLYDLSEDMVAVARKKFTSPQVQMEFMAGQKDWSTLSASRFDLVITNAVLHHIPDLEDFCAIVSQLLTPGGIFIAGHEPNASHYKNEELQEENRLFRKFKKARFRLSWSYWLFKLGLKKAPGKTPYLNIVAKTDEVLLEKKIIIKPIPALYLPKLIDIHVPITDFDQQPWGEPGFSAPDFAASFLPGFKLLSSKTYTHIKDNLAQHYSQWKSKAAALQSRFPDDGADLLMVFQKDIEP
jgi:SAM-dependent methyltransferase